MIIPDPNINSPKRKIIVELVKASGLGLYISRGTDKNAASGSDHITGNAYDIGSNSNKANILRFYSWLKDHPDRLKKLGISAVLLGTVQPHVHISFNPDKLNSDKSVYYGYEKQLSSGKIIRDLKYPGLDIISKLYPDRALVFQDQPKKLWLQEWWENLSFLDKIKYGGIGLGVVAVLPYVFNYVKKFKKD